MAAQSEINRLLFPSVRKSVRYNFRVFAYEIKDFSCTVNILRIRLTKLCELDILILINWFISYSFTIDIFECEILEPIVFILSKRYTGFPIKDARLLKYDKPIFHIILPSLSSLSRSGVFFSFEKRASFFGKPCRYYYLFNLL